MVNLVRSVSIWWQITSHKLSDKEAESTFFWRSEICKQWNRASLNDATFLKCPTFFSLSLSRLPPHSSKLHNSPACSLHFFCVVFIVCPLSDGEEWKTITPHKNRKKLKVKNHIAVSKQSSNHVVRTRKKNTKIATRINMNENEKEKNFYIMFSRFLFSQLKMLRFCIILFSFFFFLLFVGPF